MSSRKKTYYAILGLLSLKPMSGYDLKRYVDESIGHFWQENYGHIYPTLARLEKEKMASCRNVRQRGRPDRRVYSLTKRGRSELLRWMEEPVEEMPVRNELLLKMSFADVIGPRALARLLERYIDDQNRKLKEYRALQRLMDEEIEAGAKDSQVRHWRHIVRFGTSVVPSRIRWAKEVIRDLETKRGS